MQALTEGSIWDCCEQLLGYPASARNLVGSIGNPRTHTVTMAMALARGDDSTSARQEGPEAVGHGRHMLGRDTGVER